MNCKRYRRNLADGVTNRLTLGEQARMDSHSAECPDCAHSEQAERLLLTVWQKIPEAPAPDLLPRLSARLNSASPLPRPRRAIRFGYLTTAGIAAGALGISMWSQKIQDVRHGAAPAPQRSVALVPADTIPLSEMLTEVRWRSSEERSGQGEPPYNEEVRALLLPESGKQP